MVNVAERVCPPELAVMVSVRVVGTTCVGICRVAALPLRNTLGGTVAEVGSVFVSVMRMLSASVADPVI